MKKTYASILGLVCLCFGTQLAAQNEQQLISDYAQSNATQLRVTASDVQDLKISSSAYNKKAKFTTVYAEQHVNNLPVFNAIATIAIKNGAVVYAAGNLEQDIQNRAIGISPELQPLDAINAAAANYGLSTQGVVLKEQLSTSQFVFEGGNASLNDINIRLGYAEKEDESLVLAYELDLHLPSGEHWYSIQLDAASGEIINTNDWIVSCSFDGHTHAGAAKHQKSVLERSSALVGGGEYNVFAIPVESPNHGDRSIVTDPATEAASPFGWHDDNGEAGADYTITRGNNVWAFEDLDGGDDFGESPDGGADLSFDFEIDLSRDAPLYTDAATTNLFYWNNIIHDIMIEYGFDEESGNFQTMNYSDVPGADDQVFALAQNGAGLNNATFGTPPDGSSGVMRMFLWNTLGGFGNLEITSPDSLEGDIELSISNFSFTNGQPNINLFSTLEVDEVPEFDLALAFDSDTSGDDLDACDPLVNTADLEGKLVVVRRGSCNFTVKVEAAQESGALGVIVVNNNTDPIINLGGTSNLVNIPSGMINQTDGELLITALLNGEAITAKPTRPIFKDGSFDNGIITHEYGHGISNRLTGGRLNSNCLNVSEQMGEGWSDYYGMMLTMTAEDTAEQGRGVGTFAVNQPIDGPGIRPAPYSTDFSINDLTYADVADSANISQPHGIGTVWATALWEMTWELIDAFGFDPDIYNGTGGNNMALQLVTDGLKLQQCNPGFMSGRDGIIASIELNDAIAEEDKQLVTCLVWDAFARRGMGWSADEGSTNNRFDGVEAFDLPPADVIDCANLSTDEFSASRFSVYPNPSKGQLTVNVNGSFGEGTAEIFDINGRKVYNKEVTLEDNVTLDAQGLSAGVYILKLSNTTTSYSTKLIIQ